MTQAGVLLESEWEGRAGELTWGCNVVICYVCTTAAALGFGSPEEAASIARRLGWVVEPCDFWACPNCKDIPQPEHGE